MRDLCLLSYSYIESTSLRFVALAKIIILRITDIPLPGTLATRNNL